MRTGLSGDALMWAVALVAAAAVTWLFTAAGARLGAALTGGVVLLAMVVVARLAIEGGSTSEKSR